MKALLIILFTLALVACSDATDNTPSAATVQSVEPVELPASTHYTPTIEPVQICAQSNSCPPNPEPLPTGRLPSVDNPNPEPVCLRDNAPLVDMGNYLMDNCGNEYGKTQ